MKRTIIKIDESKCNGCGLCVTGCHEGALQLIDGKARMVSELFCDGLGACIGDCPEGAIELEEREAEAYSEELTIARIAEKGEDTIVAHLKHLKEHGETLFFEQGLAYLKKNNIVINDKKLNDMNEHKHEGCSCPGSNPVDLSSDKENKSGNVSSQLKQWPIQLHLLNPIAPYFKNADVLLAADCVAFAMGNFHADYLKGKVLAIACPKLDSNKESYIEKIRTMIDESNINTLTVMMMEVPCCGGLQQLVTLALQQAKRKVPIKAVFVSMRGEVLNEEWV